MRGWQLAAGAGVGVITLLWLARRASAQQDAAMPAAKPIATPFNYATLTPEQQAAYDKSMAEMQSQAGRAAAAAAASVAAAKTTAPTSAPQAVNAGLIGAQVGGQCEVGTHGCTCTPDDQCPGSTYHTGKLYCKSGLCKSRVHHGTWPFDYTSYEGLGALSESASSLLALAGVAGVIWAVSRG